MLTVPAALLGGATLAGVALVAMLQWVRPAGRVWWPGALHGLLGLAGFVALLLALGGPPRGVNAGAGQFGVIAAVLLAAAVACGSAIFAARLFGRKSPGVVLGIHATFAVSGMIMLAAYLMAGA